MMSVKVVPALVLTSQEVCRPGVIHGMEILKDETRERGAKRTPTVKGIVIALVKT